MASRVTLSSRYRHTSCVLLFSDSFARTFLTLNLRFVAFVRFVGTQIKCVKQEGHIIKRDDRDMLYFAQLSKEVSNLIRDYAGSEGGHPVKKRKEKKKQNPAEILQWVESQNHNREHFQNNPVPTYDFFPLHVMIAHLSKH